MKIKTIFEVGDVVTLWRKVEGINYNQGETLVINESKFTPDGWIEYFCYSRTRMASSYIWIREEDLISHKDYLNNLPIMEQSSKEIPEVIKNKIDYINKNILNEE